MKHKQSIHNPLGKNETDEGYVEQRYELPVFIEQWSDEQKAELAYQLLLCIPTSKTMDLMNRIAPLLHIDYISSLPYEIALHILHYVDSPTLATVSRVSRRWRRVSEDQSLWRDMFIRSGWHYNQQSMDDYLSDIPMIRYNRLRPFKMIHASRSQPLPNQDTSRHDHQHHYHPLTDSRYINWKMLYRNRSMIDRRWQDGYCRMKQFPPAQDDLLSAHSGSIYCLQFNQSILVTGSKDKHIKVWDIQTGRLRHTLKGHSRSVLCLQFDDHYLISGSSDTLLIVWDIHTGKQIRTLNGHQESVLNLKFKDNTLVSCSKDRTVRVWDIDTGILRMTLTGHEAAVNAVQFKENTIVSASGDKTIKIWDKETGICMRSLDSHSRGIACVEYDGHYIVSGSSDQTIKIWDAHTGECINSLTSHTELVRTLQLDSHSNRIVSGSYDGSLKIWSLDSGILLRSLNQAIPGRIYNLQFDYGRIVCCSNLGKIVMYDFTHGIDTQFLS